MVDGPRRYPGWTQFSAWRLVVSIEPGSMSSPLPHPLQPPFLFFLSWGATHLVVPWPHMFYGVRIYIWITNIQAKQPRWSWSGYGHHFHRADNRKRSSSSQDRIKNHVGKKLGPGLRSPFPPLFFMLDLRGTRESHNLWPMRSGHTSQERILML